MQPWNVVFLIGFAAYLGIRHVFAKRTKSQETVLNRIDGLERALLIAVIVSSLLLPVLYLFTPFLAFADYLLPAPVQGFGAAVLGGALWLFWRSHADLGSSWSVSLEIRKEHQLVTEGVYRSIRHPMYAAIWLWCIGQGLILENWMAGWAALICFAGLYVVRTPREEAMMIECFGEAYRGYMLRSGRVLPRIGRREVV